MLKTASLSDGGLWSRAARSTLWIAFGYSGAQVLRLVSNLILTRLLFPEAFGLMALVTVFLVGLTMFSDVGLGPAISHSRRGDDRDFLDTGWTLQVIRGAGLCLATAALAWPVSVLYGEPILAQLLPVAGLSLLVMGFNPTAILSAHRHLTVGRVTALELLAQVLGIGAMIALATAIQSVWALVLGGLVTQLAVLVLTWVALPGPRNRFRWEPRAARELVHFGKWIFLSTALGFLLAQGDKAILGKFVSLELLGIYNIGFFLGSFPALLGHTVISKIMIPLYRERPPRESHENFLKLRRLRSVVTGGVLALLVVLALGGVPLVEVLYDARYQQAGAIVVLIACWQMLALVGMTYDQAALAAGDSRRYFVLMSVRATLQVACLMIGVVGWGLVGALVGQAISVVLAHPCVAWLASRHRAWDPLHDAGYAVIAAGAIAAALWLNWLPLQALYAATAP